MAQHFIMNHRLVLGHGNFGSIDNDPAAAMRYTEAKLSPIAYDALLADIKDDTVDFLPNFDGNEKEPVVFPARIPILLLNGLFYFIEPYILIILFLLIMYFFRRSRNCRWNGNQYPSA